MWRDYIYIYIIYKERVYDGVYKQWKTTSKKAEEVYVGSVRSAYHRNDSPLRQEIIALLRSKGGKANYHDETGRDVGSGNGDL